MDVVNLIDFDYPQVPANFLSLLYFSTILINIYTFHFIGTVTNKSHNYKVINEK